MKELSADWRAIYGLKNYLQIKGLCADQRLICRSKKYSIFRSKNHLHVNKLPADLQIKKLSAKQSIRSAIEDLSADWRCIPFSDRRTVCTLKNYLQVDFQSADDKYLQIKELSAEQKYYKLSADLRNMC